jgi:hypothetical protein
MEFRGDDIYIPAQEHYQIETFIDGSIMTVADAPCLQHVEEGNLRSSGETGAKHCPQEDAGAQLRAGDVPAAAFMPAIAAPLFDPEVGIDLARMVHGGQEFRWGPLVVAGDEITTAVRLQEVSERQRLAFFGFESGSTNQDGDTVCVGTWSNIVRGG